MLNFDIKNLSLDSRNTLLTYNNLYTTVYTDDSGNRSKLYDK